MSDERMSNEEFSALVARSICNPAIWTEARRARAEESRLAARVEVLEAALDKLTDAFFDYDEEYVLPDAGSTKHAALIRAYREGCAALTPPTPKETE